MSILKNTSISRGRQSSDKIISLEQGISGK